MSPNKNIIRHIIEQAIYNAHGYENGFDFEKRIYWGVHIESGDEIYCPDAFGDFIDYQRHVSIDMKGLQAALAACPVFDRDSRDAVVVQEVERICEAFKAAA